MMVAATYAVLVLALVQRAPESTVRTVWWIALPLLAIAIQLGGAYWTLAYSGPPVAVSWQTEAMCFWRISALGVPSVLLVLWLLSRGLPLRPKVAGLLAGTICALVAIAPAWMARGGMLPLASLSVLLVLVVGAGLSASLAATVAAVRSPLLKALRTA